MLNTKYEGKTYFNISSVGRDTNGLDLVGWGDSN